MMSNGHSNGGRRRSPRVAQEVKVEIAGRGPDGKIFVESTSTCDLSRHGASVLTQYPFPVGAPVAVRRAGAKPARAHVVAVQPENDGPNGTGLAGNVLRVGIQFIEAGQYWDCEFPPDWQDAAAPAEDVPAEAAAAKPAAARRRIAALDDALESTIQKSEAVRLHAENTLKETESQLAEARRTFAAATAAFSEMLAARQKEAEQQLAAQVQARMGEIRSALEKAHSAGATEVAAAESAAAQMRRQFEAALQAGNEEYQRFIAEAGQQVAAAIEQLATSLDQRRSELTKLETAAASCSEEAAASLAAARRDAESLVQDVRHEFQTSQQQTLRDLRQQIPGIGQEAFKFLTNLLEEHKKSAAQWSAQALDGARAGLAESESRGRASLSEFARQLLEQHSTALQARVQEIRSGGEALTAALETRVQRARAAFEELAAAAEQALNRTRSAVGEVTEGAVKRIEAQSTQSCGDVRQAGTGALASLREQHDSTLGAVLEAERRLDLRVAEVERAAQALEGTARQQREETEGLFNALSERYDQRKAALDRLLHAVETGRAQLRGEMDSLRTAAEENQAQLHRFSAARETALHGRALELEQRLTANADSLHTGFVQRAGECVENAQRALESRIENSATATRQRVESMLEASIERANERFAALQAQLEQSGSEQSRRIEVAARDHLAGFKDAAHFIHAQADARSASLDDQLKDAQRQLTRAGNDAADAIDAAQGRAESAANSILMRIEDARAAMARQAGELDQLTIQRRQETEAHFASLADELERRRAGLDHFIDYAERLKAEMGQMFADLDRRGEEARISVLSTHRDAQAAMEKRAAALGEQLREQLRQSLHACEQELSALEDAAQEVFDARLRAVREQAIAAAEQRMEQTADQHAANLERAMLNTRREHEIALQELAAQTSQHLAEQQHRRTDTASAALAGFSDQIQQTSRAAIERVRESHEAVLRDMAARLADAEVQFRESLARAVEHQLALAASASRRD